MLFKVIWKYKLTRSIWHLLAWKFSRLQRSQLIQHCRHFPGIDSVDLLLYIPENLRLLWSCFTRICLLPYTYHQAHYQRAKRSQTSTIDNTRFAHSSPKFGMKTRIFMFKYYIYKEIINIFISLELIFI